MTQTEYATRNNISYVALRKYLERLRQKLKVVIRFANFDYELSVLKDST